MKILGENIDEGNFCFSYLNIPINGVGPIGKVGLESGSDTVLMLMEKSLSRIDLFFSVDRNIFQISEEDKARENSRRKRR